MNSPSSRQGSASLPGNSWSKNLSPPRSTTTPEPRSSRPGPPARAVAALRPRPFACATRSTASSSPPSPALSAAGRRARRTIFALPNGAPSAARSATNTRLRPAGSITAISTAMATRRHGGPGSASIRCPSRSSCGGNRAWTKSRDAAIRTRQRSLCAFMAIATTSVQLHDARRSLIHEMPRSTPIPSEQ
jgi:hypothetical protein